MTEPPAKRQRLDMRETFVAVVGEDEIEFTLYTSIATRSSKFFQAAMNREWKESQEKRITLATLDVELFEGYLQWLNTGDLTFIDEPFFAILAEFYVLGDFLDDLSFRTVVLNLFTERACEKRMVPTCSVIRLVWKQTSEGSPLRKLVVGIWAAGTVEATTKLFTDPKKNVPTEFIVECFQQLGKIHRLDNHKLSLSKRERAIRNCRHEITEG